MPTFVECSEMKDVVKKLHEERGDLFGYADPEMILCGLRTDKNQPKTQTWVLKIEGVSGSKTLLNQDIKYVIWAFDETWRALDEKHKLAYVANMLIRIKRPTAEDYVKMSRSGEDFEWGKLVRPDISDFTAFIRAFGIDWDDPNTQIPDILDPRTKLEMGLDQVNDTSEFEENSLL